MTKMVNKNMEDIEKHNYSSDANTIEGFADLLSEDENLVVELR